MKNTLFFICLIILFTSCKAKQEQSIPLKILSYNIRHGVGLDTILDLSRSAEIIRASAPDLVGLQEIDNRCSRSDSINQTDYLAQQTNMQGTFGKFMDYQGGAYGMATLSGKPIISTKLLQLPDAKYEPRIAIVQEVQIATNCNIVFANVHFDWTSEQEGSGIRLSQAKTLVSYITILNKPVIITGDFNCTPESAAMQYFKGQGFVFIAKGEDNLSYQGENPVEIDHVIYRNTDEVKFRLKSVQLLNEPVVSDHRPLLVALEVIVY